MTIIDKCWLLLLLLFAGYSTTNSSLGYVVAAPSLSSSPALPDHHDDNDNPQHRTRMDAARRLAEVSLRASAAAQGNDVETSHELLLRDLRLVLQGSFGNDNASNDDNEAELETMLTEVWNAVQKEEKRPQQTAAFMHNHEEEEEEDSEDEEDDECPSYQYHADRHFSNILETFDNYDCLEREFDVSLKDDTIIHDARLVFEKCHLVVLRNVFSKEQVQDLHSKFSKYVGEVYTGKTTTPKGGRATTHGGDSFVLHEGNKRWNILPPRNLVTSDIFAHPIIMQILSSPTILGDDLIVNHIGNINAEAGAQAQGWHADGVHLQGDDSLQDFGVAGHDLPPYAVNMFTPLLDMTHDLGPTEFCLGTSNLRGLGAEYDVLDDRWLQDGIVESLFDFDQKRDAEQPCPTGFNRIPLLNRGDVVLVDYMMTHRGGINNSSHLRSLLFITYSRKWYHDSNFDISYGEEEEKDDENEEDYDWLTKWTRFALVEKVHERDESCPSSNQDGDNPAVTTRKADERTTTLPPLESISDFLQAYDGWEDEQVEQNYYQNAG